MNNKLTSLLDVSIGKGEYGIGAPAVNKSNVLPTYLRITDINDDGTINFSGLKSVDADGYKKYLLEYGDVVFARTGNSTGRSYVYRLKDGVFVYAGFLIKFKLNISKVIPEYFRYVLLSSQYKNWIKGNVTGSTRSNINVDGFGKFTFKLPEISEQKRIADILAALDDKIELNNQMNQTLEEIASLLYKRWFVDFEFPDDKGNPYKSSGGEMVDSELGMIPKGWEVKELGEVLEISSGNRPVQKSEEKTKENIFPIVGASKIMGYTNNYILDDTNEVLIIGRVGTLGIIQEYREKIWVSDNTLIIKSNFQNYIKQYLSNVDFYSLNSGSTQPLITQTTINKLLIVVPCNKVTDKFEKIESSNVRIKFCNTYEIKKIQRLKLELLKELI